MLEVYDELFEQFFWQNFAIGMAKVCQGQGKWLAKFLADRQ